MGTTWSIDAFYHDMAGLSCYVQRTGSVGQFDPIGGRVAENTDDDWLISTYRAGAVK